jgi:hypothetical protein
MLGREGRTRIDEDGGRVIDVLVDRSCNTRAVGIEFDGFLGIGTRKIAVGWQALCLETEGKQTVAIVDVARDQLRLVPEYKPCELTVIRSASD